MKFDYHTHHQRCGHAVQTIRDYIEAALLQGLNLIGISDHSPYFASKEDQLHPRIAMAKSEFPNYIQEVLNLKNEYKGRIEVLLGVESDFFPEHIDLYQEIYRKYPFDYIIGSVHHSGLYNIFARERWEGLNEEQQIREKDLYHDLIAQSARSGLFDILGHIDAMKSNYPSFTEIKTNSMDKTLKVIGDCDVAIEVNTSGRIKDCASWHPSMEILEKALYYGVKVTFGSDAHHPMRVGDEFEEVRSQLIKIGYKEWAIFRGRNRELIPL